MEADAGDSSAAHRLSLKTQIGKGAFGIVYRGLYDGRTVAVKTLPGGEANNAAAIAALCKEAAILTSCAHSRIIGCHALVKLPPRALPSTAAAAGGAGGKQDAPQWAMVMEYAGGGSLLQTLLRQMTSPARQAYSLAQALGWALDLASALEHLHLRRPAAVLHRDVKAANVMLVEEPGGALVAKLSDFGLHMVADESKDRLVRCSEPTAAAAATAGECEGSTASRAPAAAHSLTSGLAICSTISDGSQPVPLDSSTTSDGASSSSGCGGDGRAASDSCSSRSSAQLRERGSPPAAQYAEVHDAAGRRRWRLVAQPSPAPCEAVAAGQPATAAAAPAAADRPASTAATASSGRGSSGHRAPKPSNSFRRAAHHPTTEALPRVVPALTPTTTTGGGTQAAAANTPLSAPSSAAGAAVAAGDAGGSDSACAGGSLATDGMCGTQSSGGADTTAPLSDAGGGGVHDELETVFNMTSCTGSLLYMAPEVFCGEAYNEKGDVFSYGVVLYEILARTLVMFSELPASGHLPPAAKVEWYARRVAGGYRPAQPTSVPDALWRLVSACWHQDPLLRPHMSEVVAVLSEALASEVAAQLNTTSVLRSLLARTGKRSTAPALTTGGGDGAAPDSAHQVRRARPCASSAAHRQDEDAGAALNPGCGCVIC